MSCGIVQYSYDSGDEGVLTLLIPGEQINVQY